MANLEVHFMSGFLGQSVGMNVILPELRPGDKTADGRTVGEKFPVLYLLHGLSDDYTGWARYSSIERYARDYGIAVVMPDGAINFYADNPKGSRYYYSLIAKEIPDFCKRHFACISDKREDTYIAGLSMGGYGALKIALSMPQTYCAAASFSGAVDIEEYVNDEMIRDRSFWDYVLEDTANVKGSRDDVFHLADQCKENNAKPRIYMWCGTEDALLPSNEKLAKHLSGLGYDLTYNTSGGTHSWQYWDEQINKAIAWMFAAK